MPGTEPRPQKWEARVLQLCHRGPLEIEKQGVLQINIQVTTHMIRLKPVIYPGYDDTGEYTVDGAATYSKYHRG